MPFANCYFNIVDFSLGQLFYRHIECIREKFLAVHDICRGLSGTTKVLCVTLHEVAIRIECRARREKLLQGIAKTGYLAIIEMRECVWHRPLGDP